MITCNIFILVNFVGFMVQGEDRTAREAKQHAALVLSSIKNNYKSISKIHFEVDIKVNNKNIPVLHLRDTRPGATSPEQPEEQGGARKNVLAEMPATNPFAQTPIHRYYTIQNSVVQYEEKVNDVKTFIIIKNNEIGEYHESIKRVWIRKPDSVHDSRIEMDLREVGSLNNSSTISNLLWQWKSSNFSDVSGIITIELESIFGPRKKLKLIADPKFGYLPTKTQYFDGDIINMDKDIYYYKLPNGYFFPKHETITSFAPNSPTNEISSIIEIEVRNIDTNSNTHIVDVAELSAKPGAVVTSEFTGKTTRNPERGIFPRRLLFFLIGSALFVLVLVFSARLMRGKTRTAS